MRTVNKKIAAIAAGAIVVASAGAAYAYWTTTGSGGGSAAVAAGNGTLALSSGVLSGDVTPGSSRTFSITGTNAGSTDLRMSGAIRTVVSSTDTACQALIGDFSVADVTSNVNVPAAGSAVLGTATLVYAQDSVNNQSACKSAPLTLTFSTVS